MSEIDRASSSSSLWREFSDDDIELSRLAAIAEEAELSKGLPMPENEDRDDEQAQYDDLVAQLSQPRHRCYSPEIDSDCDISALIEAYEEKEEEDKHGPFSQDVPTEPRSSNETRLSSEATIVGSTSSNIGSTTRKRLRDDSDAVTLLDIPKPAAKIPRTDVRKSKLVRDEPKEETKDTWFEIGPSLANDWQRIFNELNLPYAAQWEITRLLTIDKLKSSDIERSKLEELASLKTNAKAAPRVEKIFLGNGNKDGASTALNGRPDLFAKERQSKFPYDELDKEEDYFNNDESFKCLGCSEPDPWYGGKVVFRGRIKETTSQYAKTPEFKVVLERPELGASYRFSRRYGSSSFLRLKIPKELWKAKYTEPLIKFIFRPFFLCGYTYRFLFEKDKTVFFVRTNELLPSPHVMPFTSKRCIPDWMQFINNHNPLNLNHQQSAAKWASRFALGFSTSAPGIKLQVDHIGDEPDITSAEGSDMTDGSGFINKHGLRLLQHKFNWDEWPTAIQVRIAGAKGMLLQHPDDITPIPRLWIRPSQTKITYKDKAEDPARLIIDVLRTPHSRTHCALGAETIINLAENGVPQEVFFKLLNEGFNRLYASLMQWDGPDAMSELRITLSRLGGVMSARAARAQIGLARVKGHSSYDAQVEEDEDGMDEMDVEDSSVAWWNDEVSGQPSSLEETVMALLDSGFTPGNCAVLRDKLSRIAKTQIRNYGLQYRIEVPMSVTTFIQPDPSRTLKEGQIYFKSSQRKLLTIDGMVTDIVIGPVLVTRHPCKLPTDVQKWEAVDCLQLSNMTGVIFFSVQGSRRAADFLGGGDYDGDKALLIYDPDVVKKFDNADIKFADPRDDIEKSHFSKHTEKISELLDRAKPTKENPDTLMLALQEYLIGGLKTISLVGQYSNMHDFATYTLGYSHPETIRLAHMFCRTLDGSKTGLTVLKDKSQNDGKKYNRGTMHWKKAVDAKREFASEQPNVKRPPHLPPFIMDNIMHYAESRAKEVENDIRSKLEVAHEPDEHLIRPWEDALQRAKRCGSSIMDDELKVIQDHVSRMYTKHREQMNPQRSGKRFTDLRIETRQNQLRELSKEFEASPDPSSMVMFSPEDLRRVKASCAYRFDSMENRRYVKWTRFPWDVAFRELCAIKAQALGPSHTVQGEFYQKFSIKPSRNPHQR